MQDRDEQSPIGGNHDEIIARARDQVERSGGSPVDDPDVGSPLPGIDSDKYEIVRELHRGGQGVVYLAWQKSPRREVAIKVVKQGLLASRSEQLRFKREVETLGALHHPNVVAIHDSGGDQGFPYYVMDYVEGPTLDDYVRARRESCHGDKNRKAERDFIRETLILFTKVCDAVQAAHLRGIIHRDLKPSNIRVDHRGEPRVLDFGLAKTIVTEDVAREAATLTEIGQFVGTLAYASPEQADGIIPNLDVRTDVYSLGMILYELLTGELPYHVTGTLSEALETIKTREALKPSSLWPQLHQDVEVILLKALHKDRDRRYQTAGELAVDLRRYLAGDPIDARRDSGWYVLQKQISRHKVPVTAAVLLFAVIFFGLIVSLTFWRQAVRENSIARRETKKAVAINDFLYEILASSDPFRRPGEPATVRDILKDAEARLDAGAFVNQPEVEAAVRNTLGMSLLAIEHNDEAISQLEAVLTSRRENGEGNMGAVAESLHNLGRAYFQSTDYDAAVRYFTEARDLRIRNNPEGDIYLAESEYWIGAVHHNRGMIAEAKEQYQKAIEILDVNDDRNLRTQCYKALGAAAARLGDIEQAVDLARQSYVTRREAMGDHPYVADSLMGYGNALAMANDLAGALEAYEEAVEMCRRHLGRHPVLAAALSTAGILSRRIGKYEDSLAYIEEAAELFREFYDDTDRRVAATLAHMSRVLRELGRLDEAEAVRRESLALNRKAGYRIESAISAIGLSTILQEAGRLEEGESVLREAIETARADSRPLPDSVMAQLLANLGHIILGQGRAEEAEPFAREAMELFRNDSLTRNPWMPLRKEVHLIMTGNVLGRCLVHMERFSEAEQILLEVNDMLAEFDPLPLEMEKYREGNISTLVSLYQAWHETDPLAGHDKNAGKWRKKVRQE
ncbi:MAG: tetratricopeptide repeat protein [Planctomycetota bacterium]